MRRADMPEAPSPEAVSLHRIAESLASIDKTLQSIGKLANFAASLTLPFRSSSDRLAPFDSAMLRWRKRTMDAITKRFR